MIRWNVVVRKVACAGFFLVGGIPTLGLAGDLDKAPPSFAYRSDNAVPIDIETISIEMTFDASSGTATGKSRIAFKTGAAGMPFFDLVPNPTAIHLDGQNVSLSDFALVTAPGAETKLRVLAVSLPGDSQHEVEIDYPVPDVTFQNGHVRAGFFMDDLMTGGRGFFEQYGPANLEFDQVQYTFHVKVTGSSVEHEIFTNGQLTNEGDGAWSIEFPPYFTTSSLYFHLSEKGRFNVQRYTYSGVGAEIPVTVYSSSSNLTQSGVSRSRSVLAELEQTYGAFAHPRVIIYITADGGGMEHCGATMTSVSALGHELTHSYFARGVMPANGNAGWIDEAVASWRDNGYPRGNAPNWSPVNLGGFTTFRRNTPDAAYSYGASLISSFDGMFSSKGGMRSILRQLFTEHKLTTITVEFFQSYLEKLTGSNLTSIFSRYVRGRSSAEFQSPLTPELLHSQGPKTSHPRPFTRAELEIYR